MSKQNLASTPLVPEPEASTVCFYDTDTMNLEQRQRLRRILDAAIGLAERGGYEAVRLRDVAEAAGVAIATLYRYFENKEELLTAAMHEDFSNLEAYFRKRPAEGATAVNRVMAVFKVVTRGITQHPKYGQALLRAISSGQLSRTSKAHLLHNRLSRLLFSAIHPDSNSTVPAGATLDELDPPQRIAGLLDRIWFSSIVGWAGGIQDVEGVLREVRAASELLLAGSGNASQC